MFVLQALQKVLCFILGNEILATPWWMQVLMVFGLAMFLQIYVLIGYSIFYLNSHTYESVESYIYRSNFSAFYQKLIDPYSGTNNFGNAAAFCCSALSFCCIGIVYWLLWPFVVLTEYVSDHVIVRWRRLRDWTKTKPASV